MGWTEKDSLIIRIKERKTDVHGPNAPDDVINVTDYVTPSIPNVPSRCLLWAMTLTRKGN